MSSTPKRPRILTDLESRIRNEKKSERLTTLVEQAVEEQDFFALRAAAHARGATMSALARLAEQPYWAVLEAVARNRNTARDTLSRIVFADLVAIRDRLRGNLEETAAELDLEPDVLERDLAEIDRVLAKTIDLPDPSIRDEPPWRYVCEKAALHARLDPGARRGFVYHDDPIIRAAIATRLDVSDDELITLGEDDSWRVAATVAYRLSQDPERLPELLAALQADEHDGVRNAASGIQPSTNSIDKVHQVAHEDLWPFGSVRSFHRSLDSVAPEPSEPTELYGRCVSAQTATLVGELIDEALAEGDTEAMRILARKHAATAADLDRLAKTHDHSTMLFVVTRNATSADTLDHVVGLGHDRVPIDVWRAPEYVAILEGAAAHPRLSPPARRFLGISRLHSVRRTIAGRCDLSDSEIVAFAEDPQPAIRDAVLGMLSKDHARLPAVRAALAADRDQRFAADVVIDLTSERPTDASIVLPDGNQAPPAPVPGR